MLKIILMNTPGLNIIIPYEATKDGRNAYLALKKFNEGEDFIDRSIKEGFSNLYNMFYRSKSSCFTFECFVAIQVINYCMMLAIIMVLDSMRSPSLFY